LTHKGDACIMYLRGRHTSSAGMVQILQPHERLICAGQNLEERMNNNDEEAKQSNEAGNVRGVYQNGGGQ